MQCSRCGDEVNDEESNSIGEKTFHSKCFVCALCHKPLDSTNASAGEVDVYCKQCFGRKFGPKGVGFGVGAGSLDMDHTELRTNEESAASNKDADEEDEDDDE